MSMYTVPEMADILARIAQLVSTGSVVPHISGEYSLEDAVQAHRETLSKSFIGKELLII